jgi:hypothetical protein
MLAQPVNAGPRARVSREKRIRNVFMADKEDGWATVDSAAGDPGGS